METKREQEEKSIVGWVANKFQESFNTKQPMANKWSEYLKYYNGEVNEVRPDYKSDLQTNLIYSTLESMIPIMADEEAVFEVLPRNVMGTEYADVVNKCLDFEFQREGMRNKIIKQCRTALQLGTAVFFVPWDGHAGKDGEVRCIPVNPFNIFIDPTATSLDEAEYLIYATYKHVNQVKKLFPEMAERIDGGDIKYKTLAGNGSTSYKTETQVLILECWCRDYTYIDVEEEVDGEKVKKKKRKYPNGRVITCAPELEVLFADKANPYNDGKFPFVVLKDIDVPFEFWGKGDIEQLISPQKYINELSNQIIDNAKATGNMQWIIDKNAGIPVGKVTNRPGQIIRKNPGAEVRREQPPAMPAYVQQQIEAMKFDIETISGVHDVTQGRRPGGIQAGNAIMALQEAGQARIRVKIKLLEESLTELARMWYSRMKQFWVVDRYVRITKEDGVYEFLEVNKQNFNEEFDINIKTGSTMQKNKANMLDLYIRLAQTMAEDGLPMIDRESVLEYTPVPNKREVLQKFENIKNDQMQQQMQQVQQQYEEQKMMLEQEIANLSETNNQMNQQLQQLSSEVQRINQEHESIKMEERLTDASDVGYEQGVNEMRKSLVKIFESIEETDEFVSESIESDKLAEEQDADILEMINSLSDEELGMLLQQYPELAEVIGRQQIVMPSVGEETMTPVQESVDMSLNM